MNTTAEPSREASTSAVRQNGNGNTGAAEEVFDRPRYRTSREGDHWTAEIFMPGVSRKDVSISIDERVLTITGNRSHAAPEGWRPLHEELRKPNYRLRLKLTDEIDGNRIGAKVEAGVLRLTLPVAEAAKPRTIEVR